MGAGVAYPLPSCGKGTTPNPATHYVAKVAPRHGISPALGEGGASQVIRKGFSQESHAQEQRSLVWGFSCALPLLLPPPRPALPAWRHSPLAQVCPLGTQLPSPPGTPPGCLGGRRGKQAGQGNQLAQRFVVTPVVLQKAWMWARSEPGEAAEPPSALASSSQADPSHGGTRVSTHTEKPGPRPSTPHLPGLQNQARSPWGTCSHHSPMYQHDVLQGLMPGLVTQSPQRAGYPSPPPVAGSSLASTASQSPDPTAGRKTLPSELSLSPCLCSAAPYKSAEPPPHPPLVLP